MKYALTLALSFLVASSTFAQGVERAVEYNRKDISITSSTGEVIYKSLHDIDRDLKKALEFYGEEKYAEAYPIAAELSQWGIKRAQTLLGGMYVGGLHVDQSTIRGLVWLGVAKEKKSEKQATRMFNEIYNQLGDEQKAYVDSKVDSYVAKFGAKAQNLKCKKRRVTGTNISQVQCSKARGSNSTLYPIG